MNAHYTPLFEAVLTNNTEAVDMLLAHPENMTGYQARRLRIDPSVAQSSWGKYSSYTALELAVQRDNMAVVRRLLNDTRVRITRGNIYQASTIGFA